MKNLESNNDLDQLLFLVGQGDATAFRVLHDRTASKLYAVLIRVLKDERDAADALQDTYVTIWNRAGRFDPGRGRAPAWLAVIARNTGIDALRRRRPGHISDENCAELEDSGLSPFEDLNKKKVSEFVRRNVETLPDNQRDAVRLFYLEEHKLHEVAAMMDAPLNTTKSWVRRGLENLKSRHADRTLTEYL